MSRRSNRSVSTPIVLTTVAVSLSITLLVGWTLVIVHTFLRGPELAGGVWLLVAGIVSFIFVVTVLVMFGISLVGEILEARRQVSFMDSVTHELKSPLASLGLCLQTLARPHLSGGQKTALLHMMEADVGRLSAFIEDILNASRAAWARQPSSVSEVDMRTALMGIIERVARRHSVEAGAISLEVEKELTLTTDQEALEVVIANILDNAVKYSNPPIEVGVTAARQDDTKVLIEVRDRGIGIKKCDLKMVFRRFYRAPEKDVRARSGTGLGLYVAATMIDRLGGKIQAEPTRMGKGTLMRIILPAKLACTRALGAEPESNRSEEAHSSFTTDPARDSRLQQRPNERQA